MQITAPMSKQGFQYLIDYMADGTHCITTLATLKEDLRHAASELIDREFLVKTRPAQSIWVALEEEDECMELEWDDERRCHVYYDRFSGKYYPAPLDEITRYKLDFHALLKQISTALKIQSEPVKLVGDLLWDLGDYVLGSRKIPTLFARRMHHSDCQELMHSALTNRAGRSGGLILTSTDEVPKYLSLPGKHHIVPISTCIKSDTDYFQLDNDIIAGLFKPQRPQSAKKQQKIECHNGGGLIIINDDDGESRQFTFTGSKQKQCLEYIYQCWENGETEVNISKMFEDLDFVNTRRLTDLFKKKPGWKELIGYKGNLCWFITD